MKEKEVKISKSELRSLHAAYDIIFNVAYGADNFKRYEKIAADLMKIFNKANRTVPTPTKAK